MNSKQFSKRAAALGLALLLLVSTMAFPAFAAETAAQNTTQRNGVAVTVEIQVQVDVENSKTRETLVQAISDDELEKLDSPLPQFRFVLTPKDPQNPMPDASQTTINGAGKVSFGEIYYTKPGIYEYTVHQDSEDHPDYELDDTKYDLKITVIREEGLLKASSVVYKEGEDEKSDGIVFYNDFLEVPEEPTPTPTPSTDPSPTPEPSYEPTPTPTTSPSPSPSPSPTPTPSEEPTPTPSEEPTPEPSEEPTPEPSTEPTPEPSEKPEWRHDDEPIKVPPDHEAPVIMDELPNPNDPEAPNFVTIFEDGVPLTFMKTEDPETGEMIYVLIEDEEVPQNSDPGVNEEYTDGSPKTGDETDNTRWFVLIGAAAVGAIACVVWLVVPKKRRR